MIHPFRLTFSAHVIGLFLISCQPLANLTGPGLAGTSTLPANELAAAEFEGTQYQPRSMVEIIDRANAMLNLEAFRQDPHDSILLEMEAEHTFPSTVTTIYHGEFRKIPKHHMFAISTWLRSPRPSMTEEDVLAIFQYEGRFSEGPTSDWLPIQSELVTSMQEELRPGDKADMFIRWIALTELDDIIDYILIVNAWYGPL